MICKIWSRTINIVFFAMDANRSGRSGKETCWTATNSMNNSNKTQDDEVPVWQWVFYNNQEYANGSVTYYYYPELKQTNDNNAPYYYSDYYYQYWIWYTTLFQAIPSYLDYISFRLKQTYSKSKNLYTKLRTLKQSVNKDPSTLPKYKSKIISLAYKLVLLRKEAIHLNTLKNAFTAYYNNMIMMMQYNT